MLFDWGCFHVYGVEVGVGVGASANIHTDYSHTLKTDPLNYVRNANIKEIYHGHILLEHFLN